MNECILLISFFMFTTTLALGQPASIDYSSKYLKRIENNYRDNTIVQHKDGRIDGRYNLDSKSAVEKLFFGDFNAPIEYYYDPSSEASQLGPFGLRIYRNTTGKHVLEVKHIVNFQDVNSALDKEFPVRSILWNEQLSEEQEAEIRRQNQNMMAGRNEQRLKRYRIVSKIVPLDDTLAIKLYNRTVHAIDIYASSGKPEGILDGYSATFRTVVRNDVWTLRIDNPSGDLETLSDLFRAMIADVEAGKFDEAKYIEALN